jgi:hypothetical protein
VRNHPTSPPIWNDAFKRDDAFKRAAGLAKAAGTDPRGAETVRDSYSRAIKGLTDEGQYWQAPTEFLTVRLHMALQNLPARHQERLAARRRK